MSKYLIKWTEEDWYKVEVEAASKEEALNKFYQRDYNHEDIVHMDSYLQESIEVEEV